MAETATARNGAAPVPADALRVVLFGIPDAGKSSLLGALAQSAQTQEHLLNGHLTDLSRGLEALQKRLYDGQPRETLDEVVPYAVVFQPFTPPTGGRRLEAVLVDCDGRAANELLSRRKRLDPASGSLAGAILGADALVLAVDCSAAPAQVDADFAEFGRFLRLLEQRRGQQAEVAGLPVYLVLTKCDLLAKSGDSGTDWIERIEAKKREVDAQFRRFLERQGPGPRPFGHIDLHLWATAVKHPTLAETPAKPRDPFGVAELFRQCFNTAEGYRQRQVRSGRRLFWTAAGTGSVVALMAGLATLILTGRRPDQPPALEGAVQNFRAHEDQSPAQRFREPLRRKLDALEDLRNDPEFDRLPAPERDYVDGRLQDLRDYAAYKERLLRIRPAEARSEADLDRLAARLANGDLAPPAGRESEWSGTDAAQVRERLGREVQSLRSAAADSADWYRDQARQAEELRTFARGKPADAPSWAEWQAQVGDLLGRAFPHTDTETLPGSATLTYGAVLGFNSVVEARRDWEGLRHRLSALRDLTAALGLAGRLPDGTRQPLDIPDHFPVAQARQILSRLSPGLRDEIASVELPEAVASDVRRAARLSYEHLIDGGRDVVLDHLRRASPDGTETVAAWQRVREWLTSPEELADWRVLASLLGRLKEPESGDPVTALADFLRQERFEIDPTELTLEAPFDRSLRPAGALSVAQGTGGAAAVPVLTFAARNEDGSRDPRRRVTVYDLARQGGGKLTYRPGDTLSATLPVRREGVAGDWFLTWDHGRSKVYQLDRLMSPPRLRPRGDEAAAGETVGDVRLLPPASYPRLPDLMPVVER